MGENVATKAAFHVLRADLDTLKSNLDALERRITAHLSGRFEALYQNLWATAIGIVAVTVTLG